MAWPETLVLGGHLCARLGAPPPDEQKFKACYEASDKNCDGVLTAEEFTVFFDLFLRFELAFLDEKMLEIESRAARKEPPKIEPPRAVNGCGQALRGGSSSQAAPYLPVSRWKAQEPSKEYEEVAIGTAGGAFGGASLGLFLLMLI